MSRYTSATDDDRRAMLAAIGAESVDALFDEVVPPGVRLDRPLDLPPGKPEQEVYAYLRDLAARNVSAEDEITFLGAGMYDHYVPAIVDSILSRSEVLTPYTPYQPEVSQGTLQVMFEYQTAISELTGLPGLQRDALRGAVGARLGGLARVPDQPPPALPRLARAAPALAPGARRDQRGVGEHDRGDPARRPASPTPRRWRRRWATTSAPCSCSTRTSSARSRTSRRSCPPRAPRARS